MAFCFAVLLLIAFCVTLPFSNRQLSIVTAFVPIYATIITVNDLITAALLAAQFWVVRWTWLLVLACGFFYTALISIPFVATFPGVFAPTGLFGAGLQSASWLATCLHSGLPLTLVLAMLVRGGRDTTRICQRSPVSAIILSICLVIALVCGLTWAILANDDTLPQVLRNSFQLRQSVAPIVAPMITLDLIALALLLRRGRSVLDLWLMVTCCGWLFMITTGALFAGSRYSLGWYTGRIAQIATTYAVLLLLLSETTALYANMVRTSIQRRGARQGRQIAMDAMAASIGHEIKQPLAALIMNGGAGLHLTKADPNLKEVHAIISDMVAEGKRIGQIIGSVRTLFKESTHDRTPLNLNTVVRDALAAVELELRVQHVTVKMDLDNGLPSVLADNGQLHQVFLNLVTNALEAMIGVIGRPRVLAISSGAVSDSSDLAVTVEDTGSGIAAEDTDHIFEPFFSTKAAGTGVGLTICRVIVEAHGGRFEVRPNKPYGTIFRVILPKDVDE